MTIREELLSIQEKNDGVLRPRDAVEWARKHPKSALHESLEWDDDKAAEEYRYWQVRQLISIHIVNADTGVREAVSLSIDRYEEGGGYRKLDEVLSSRSMREILLADALADLERVRKKYEMLVELAQVWSEVDKVRRKRGASASRASSSTATVRP